MPVRFGYKAACLTISLIGLSACGSEPVDPALFESEVQTLKATDDMYGQLYTVLEEHRPELYTEFRKIALHQYNRGYDVRDAGYLAGMHMRDDLLGETLKLSRVASDEHVREMIGITLATYEHVKAEDPTDCVRLMNGRPLKTVKNFPKDLRKRETQLFLDLMTAPQTVANRRAASQKEVLNWTTNLATLEPDVGRMVNLMKSKKRTDKDAPQICKGAITMYKRLSYKKGESRGTLFRGMALSMLQKQQVRRNTEPQEEA